MPAEQRRRINGCTIAMIFQDPLAHLNPVYTVGWQIAEMVRLLGAPATRRRPALGLLRRVRIPEPEAAMRKYPHQFSGGQRQRIAIARALAMEPRLIVCDEAVSALDGSIQAQVIELLDGLRREFGLSYLFIAHDLPVVRDFADRVVIMKWGEMVEKGPVRQIFDAARHPYTRALLSASLDPDPAVQATRRAARQLETA